jgi:3-hydroxyacyl-[acyl-carrier-protein] dehydratase
MITEGPPPGHEFAASRNRAGAPFACVARKPLAPEASDSLEKESGMPPLALVDPAKIDTSRILFDQAEIRLVNPQRFEMEQLTAIVAMDTKNHLIIGYKDVRDDEFWVRGHMPDYPLMPGVLICEAAAQLASYYTHTLKIVEDGFLGFGGMEDVRFRGRVHPGDRLVIIAKGIRMNRRQTIFETQAFVDTNMVFHARVLGVPLGAKADPAV